MHRNVVEGDRTRFFEPVPIVEDVGGVGQQRCLSQAIGQRADWTGKIGWQSGGRLGLAPDIGLYQEGIMHHRGAHLFLRRGVGPIRDVRVGKAVEEVPYPPGSQQGGQIFCRLNDWRERPGKCDRVDFIMRKIAALAAHTVVFKLHVGCLIAGRGLGRPINTSIRIERNHDRQVTGPAASGQSE